jgi:flavin-dependent dehydrogenase
MLVTLGFAMSMLGEHAVVLGASMSGLLAARVLADHFQTVTVVDRDELPDEPVNRRGVPQGRHVHVAGPQ